MFETSTPYDVPPPKLAENRLSESGWTLLIFTIICYWLPMLVFAYACCAARFPEGMELLIYSGMACIGGIVLTWIVYLIYGRTSRSRHPEDRRFFRAHAWVVFLIPVVLGTCAIASR